MRTLLRITLLGAFAAAGIAVAIAVATHAPLVERAGETSGRRTLFDGARGKNNYYQSFFAGSDQELPPSNVTPIIQAYDPPVARKIEQLQQKLDLMTQSSKRDQMARLEEKLSQIADENRQRQRQLEDAAERQNRHLEDASRRNEALIMRLAQAATLQQPTNNIKQNEPEELQPPDQPKIDIRQGEGDNMLSLHLKDDPLREVLEYLSAEGNMNILAMPGVQGNISASLANVDVQTALDAILRSTGYLARRDGNFVYVGTPEELDKMDLLSEQISTRIYQTNYVTAAEIQKLITPMMSPRIGVVTVSTAAQVGVPSDVTGAGGDAFAGNEVIVVKDYEKVLREVDELVKHVDRRPRQVSIEAMILSVTLDDSHKFGINWEFLKNSSKVRVIGNSPLVDLAKIDVSGGGLNIGFLDSDVAGFVSALDSIGDTDVIASPHLVCLNKQRAEILIGDQKGYVSTTQTETSSTQTVEFLDLGTQLRIRPYISSDGMIRLEVHPELSTGDVKLLGSFALPEKSTTQVTSNIMCRDGCTIVIGGLIREDLTESVTQIPLLGKIPVLGSAFRSTVQTVKRDEIVVLLTPRIVEDPAYCETGNECFQDRTHRQATIQASRMTAIGKHHYSNRYYRLADAAWRAGNIDVAMDYLELALYFHPKNKEAAKLRGMIMNGPAPIDFMTEPKLHEIEEVESQPLKDDVFYDELSSSANRPASLDGSRVASKLIAEGSPVSNQSLATKKAPTADKIPAVVDPLLAQTTLPDKDANAETRPLEPIPIAPPFFEEPAELDDPPEPTPLPFLQANESTP